MSQSVMVAFTQDFWVTNLLDTEDQLNYKAFVNVDALITMRIAFITHKLSV